MSRVERKGSIRLFRFDATDAHDDAVPALRGGSYATATNWKRFTRPH